MLTNDYYYFTLARLELRINFFFFFSFEMWTTDVQWMEELIVLLFFKPASSEAGLEKEGRHSALIFLRVMCIYLISQTTITTTTTKKDNYTASEDKNSQKHNDNFDTHTHKNPGTIITFFLSRVTLGHDCCSNKIQ